MFKTWDPGNITSVTPGNASSDILILMHKHVDVNITKYSKFMDVEEKSRPQYADCANDDELVLYLSKKL